MAPDKNGDRDRRDTEGKGSHADEAFMSRLRDLGRDLRRVRKPEPADDPQARRGTALGLAFRLAVELVAGLVVGGAIGWFIDRWLGTLPIFMLLFFGLGTAAGILNVFRTARQMQAGVSDMGKDLGPDDDE